MSTTTSSIRDTEVGAVAVDDETWIAKAVANGLPESAAEGVASFSKAIREGALLQRSGDLETLIRRPPISVADVLQRPGVTTAA